MSSAINSLSVSERISHYCGRGIEFLGGEEWLFLTLLGVSMAFISFLMDYTIEKCIEGEFAIRNNDYRSISVSQEMDIRTGKAWSFVQPNKKRKNPDSLSIFHFSLNCSAKMWQDA